MVDLSVLQDGVDDADADPMNEIQDISLSGTDLSITGGATVDLSVLQDGTGGWTMQEDTSTTGKYVGIGVSNPNEKLVVDGAIKLGENNDDNPMPGTIRWNECASDFEGYDGSRWRSLTTQSQFLGKPVFSYSATENINIPAPEESFGQALGFSVSISEDFAIVGDYLDVNYKGLVRFYEKFGDQWKNVKERIASDANGADRFGYSVSISGDYAVVGAPYADLGPFGTNAGAAYIFQRTASGWIEVAKLAASDAASSNYFGHSVSIDGDNVIIGAYGHNGRTGAAYIFIRSGTSWTEQAKLTPSDGNSSDYFGWSVSISGHRVIIGSPLDDDDGISSGSAYTFFRSDVVWIMHNKLTASDGATLDKFGHSVAISGDYAVVGAVGGDDNGSDSGSAYVFRRQIGPGWTEQVKLLPDDGAMGDNFGASVAISGGQVLVGANFHDHNGNDSGSAFLFKRTGTEWDQIANLNAFNGLPEDNFGISVSISDSNAVVGAHLVDNIYGHDSGAAYFY